MNEQPRVEGAREHVAHLRVSQDMANSMFLTVAGPGLVYYDTPWQAQSTCKGYRWMLSQSKYTVANDLDIYVVRKEVVEIGTEC